MNDHTVNTVDLFAVEQFCHIFFIRHYLSRSVFFGKSYLCYNTTILSIR